MRSDAGSRREQYLDRALPNSEESEKVIIGSVILDNLLMDELSTLTADAFYNPLYRRIFAAMRVLYAKKSPINSIFIGEELKKEGSLSSIGGVATITNITLGVPYSPNLKPYLDKLLEDAKARQLVHLCSETTAQVLSQESELAEVMEVHERQVFALRQDDTAIGFRPVSVLAVAAVNEAAERSRSGVVSIVGIPSGLKDLDEMTLGYQRKHLTILAGRPSMGKTAFALQAVINATNYDPDFVVAIFSLEMSTSECIDRMLCMEARINAHRFAKGHIMTNEWSRLADAATSFSQRRIVIDDEPQLRPSDIAARCRRLKAKEGRLDMFVVDHLGYMKGSGRKERHLELGEITKALKIVAKEMDAAGLILSQLSRNSEHRADHKPMMSDIRESGNIEEDANSVHLLYRPEYYRATDEPGVAKIIVGKNRNGPTGTVNTTFLKEYMRFENYQG